MRRAYRTQGRNRRVDALSVPGAARQTSESPDRESRCPRFGSRLLEGQRFMRGSNDPENRWPPHTALPRQPGGSETRIGFWRTTTPPAPYSSSFSAVETGRGHARSPRKWRLRDADCVLARQRNPNLVAPERRIARRASWWTIRPHSYRSASIGLRAAALRAG
jgi:hypothetical protein